VPYLLRRLLQIPVGLWIVGSVVFVLIHLAPGGPVVALSGEYATDDIRREIERLYGLDRPLPEQYLTWLLALLRGDLGTSYLYKAPVLTVILERLPVTLAILLPAAFLSSLIAIALAVWSTPPAGRSHRHGVSILSLVAHSLPSFWVAQGLVLAFAFGLAWLPVQGLDDARRGAFDLVDRVRHLVLPVATLALHQIAMSALTLRAALHAEVHRPYMATALAKGMTFARAKTRHALVNAVLPLIALFGGRLGAAFVGAIAIETVFALPGLGRLVVSAAINRDHPLALGVMLLVCVGAMGGNLIADLAMNRLDPRAQIGSDDAFGS
jgi:peptide/nickel transport system permease protein